MNKEPYVEAQVEIIRFDSEDVIATSGDAPELPFSPYETDENGIPL